MPISAVPTASSVVHLVRPSHVVEMNKSSKLV